MSYSIQDFDSHDWGQYFNDSYVNWNTKAGKERVGYIQGFTGEKAVIRDEHGSTSVVALSAIRWSGLIRTRCIAHQGNLLFVSPSGARSHKKPPTLRNTIALMYSDGSGVPQLLGSGMPGGRLNTSVINAYLDDRQDYPETFDEVRELIRYDQRAIPLSQSHGIYYCPHRDVTLCIVDGAVISRGTGYGNIPSFVEEAKHGS